MGKQKIASNNSVHSLVMLLSWIILLLAVYAVYVSYAIYGFLTIISLSISIYSYKQNKHILTLCNMIFSIIVILYSVYVSIGSI